MSQNDKKSRVPSLVLPLLLLGVADHGATALAQPYIISTYAGGGSAVLGDGGPATSVQLQLGVGLDVEGGMALDGAGNLYIAETGAHRVRKVSPDGTITTVAGIGPQCPGHLLNDCVPVGDGGPATSAALSLPTSVAVDSKGNLFIADYGNFRIRKVSPDGMITTVAGSGTPGYSATSPYSGDSGPATNAQLGIRPLAVAVDSSGNLFLAGGGNVRKVSADGEITTVAGGPWITAAAVDAADNLFIAANDVEEQYCDNSVVELSTAGVTSRIAGASGACNIGSGDGGAATAAQLGFMSGIAVDGVGNVFTAELYGRQIRRIDTAGIITTVAGSGALGYSGDSGPATKAAMGYPSALAADRAGNVYVAVGQAVLVLQPTHHRGGDGHPGSSPKPGRR